ncbi:transposase [Streptomyces sp. NPDC058872]|uniref:transposase n=1 Tax=Streptomyces sp. NPDC058872 TaxID=3346661 RepID=UPI003686B689
MTPDEIASVHGELEDFATEAFEPFARNDRRRWGQVCPRGLLTDGQRKSVEPMAAREDELAPELRRAHAERLGTVAAHLVRVVEQAAAVGFADEVFAEGSVREAHQAYELWARCLEERRRDLGQPPYQ